MWKAASAGDSMNTRIERQQAFHKIDLYPVISSEFTNGRSPLAVLTAIALGGAKIVQLREKNLTTEERYQLAGEFRKTCDEYGILLIINDHLDLALACGADGVHLGQDDYPLPAARKLAPELLLGASTHSREEALQAQTEGADYVNLGPIYPTQTKHTPSPALGPETIKDTAPLLTIPFTVMGGIKQQHLPELISLGATRIAMVTEITQAEDITARVKELRSCFQ